MLLVSNCVIITFQIIMKSVLKWLWTQILMSCLFIYLFWRWAWGADQTWFTSIERNTSQWAGTYNKGTLQQSFRLTISQPNKDNSLETRVLWLVHFMKTSLGFPDLINSFCCNKLASQTSKWSRVSFCILLWILICHISSGWVVLKAFLSIS